MVTAYAEGASPMAARSSRAGWSTSTRVDHYVRCGCCFLIKSYNKLSSVTATPAVAYGCDPAG